MYQMTPKQRKFIKELAEQKGFDSVTDAFEKLLPGKEQNIGTASELIGLLKNNAKGSWVPCGYPGCKPGICDECEGKGGRHHRY